jgi:hypothetical protein
MFRILADQIKLFNSDYLKLYLETVGHGFKNNEDAIVLEQYIIENQIILPFHYEFFYSQCADFVIMELVKLHLNKLKIKEELIRL